MSFLTEQFVTGKPMIYLWPVLYAIFLWWFTTGLIMAVYGCPRRVQRIYFAVATVVMLVALAGLVATRNATQIGAVYVAVTCGAVIWGWHMASYYLGFVTGRPLDVHVAHGQDVRNRRPLDLAQRFRLALDASLYHELLVLGFMLLLSGLIGPHANRWGLWMFLALWFMHSSAKLNVFFGVRNFRIEFLPNHLHGLGALLSKRPINEFFAVSMGVASSVVLLIIYRAFVLETSPAHITGALLLGTMILLGVIEQWLLVLPLPFTLWGWGVRFLPQPNERETDASPEKSANPSPKRHAHTSIRALSERVIVNPMQRTNEG